MSNRRHQQLLARSSCLAAVVGIAWSLLPTPSFGAEPAAAASSSDALVVLETHCVRCHGGESTKGGLNLLTRDALPTSGQVFKAIKGGDFDECEYDRARDERYAKREGFY